MKKYSANYQNVQEKNRNLFLGKDGSAFTESELMEIFDTQKIKNTISDEIFNEKIKPNTDVECAKSNELLLSDFRKCFETLNRNDIEKNHMEILSDFRTSNTQYKESLKVALITLIMLFPLPLLGLSTASLMLSAIVLLVFALWSIFKIAFAIGKNWQISMKMKERYGIKSFAFNFSNLILFLIAPILSYFSLTLQNKEISSKLDLFAVRNGLKVYDDYEKEQDKKDKEKKTWWKIWK